MSPFMNKILKLDFELDFDIIENSDFEVWLVWNIRIFVVLMDRFPSNHSFIEGSLIAFAFDLSEADGNEPSADHLLGNIIKDSWARQPQDYRFHPHPDYHQPTRSFSSIWRFGWKLSTSWNWSQFRSNPPLSPPQSIIYANVIAVLLQKC